MNDYRIAQKYISQHQKASTRDKPCTLSFNEYKRLILSTKCYFTKEPFGEGEEALSLECLDPAKGYVSGNVVAAKIRINQAKNNLTPLEVKLLYQGLKRKGFYERRRRIPRDGREGDSNATEVC